MASSDLYRAYIFYKVPGPIRALFPVLFSPTHFLPYGSCPGGTSFHMEFYKQTDYLLQQIAAIKMITLQKVSGAWTFVKSNKIWWLMQ
jgi:hypothetical protein